MYGKNILSLVSLAFIGSQLINITEGAAIDNCSAITQVNGADYGETAFKELSDCGSIEKYCKIGNLFYGVDSLSNASCSTVLNGAYVIKDDTPVNLGSNLADGLEGLRIYTCNGVECNKATGVFKANDGYYKVETSADSDPTSLSSTHATGDCVVGKIDTSGTPALCLGGGITPLEIPSQDNGGYYIMANAGKNNFPADDGNTGKDFVIQVGKQVFAFDAGYSASEAIEVFSKKDTNQILSRKDNFCSANAILNTMYSCQAGLCDGVGVLAGSSYLVGNKIYSFTADDCATVSAGTYAVVPIEGDDTASIVIDDFTDIQDITAVKLYSCDATGTCATASGFIKYDNDKANLDHLAYCNNGDCDAVAASNKINSASDCTTGRDLDANVGKALYDGTDLKICTKIGDQAYALPVIAADTTYFLSVTAGDVNTVTQYVSTGNAVAITTTLADNFYLVKSNALITSGASAQSDPTLVSCATNTCTAVGTIAVGYYKNAASTALPYIKCISATSCQLIAAPTVECNSDNNIGQLTSNSKICLANTKESQPFNSLSTDPVVYAVVNPVAASTGNVFAGISADEHGLIKITHNSMTYDTSALTMCVDSDWKATVKSGECAGSTAYSCAGTCSTGASVPSTTACNVSNGSSCENDSYVLVTSSEGNTLAGNDAGYLYYCASTGAACQALSTKGYYVKDADEIYSCNGTAGACIKISKGSSCSGTTVGQIVTEATAAKGVALCLSNSIIAKIGTDEGNYLTELNTAAATLFSTSSDAGKSAFVVLDKNTGFITLKTDWVSTVKYVYMNDLTNEVLTKGQCPSGVTTNVDEFTSRGSGIYESNETA